MSKNIRYFAFKRLHEVHAVLFTKTEVSLSMVTVVLYLAAITTKSLFNLIVICPWMALLN